MKLKQLPAGQELKGQRVLMRVDWNVPLKGELAAVDSLKFTAVKSTIADLRARQAVVIIMTHLGRPKNQEDAFSTRHLLPKIKAQLGLDLKFIKYRVDQPAGLAQAKKIIHGLKPGQVCLLENVRFFKGEGNNDPRLARALASLGDLFINEAFASSHRAHASVVGVTDYAPAYAGPALCAEVQALARLLHHPAKPFVAVIGGAKLSGKIETLKILMEKADKVLIGAAMAHVFFLAKGLPIGKSLVEKETLDQAKQLVKNKKLVLPVDVIVAKQIVPQAKVRVVPIQEVGKLDMIGDIGTETMIQWSKIIRGAKTLVWNGPVGVTEIPIFSHGSKILMQIIAARSRGPAFGVVGGGDTLPIVMESGMSQWMDHVSTGGGAMLEFIEKNGQLPGLKPLFC